MNALDKYNSKLEKADVDYYNQLHEYIETGTIKKAPPEIIEYYERLDTIRSMHQKGHSKTFIINTLVASGEKRERALTKYIASKLYSDALNFFYLDAFEIKKAAFRNSYAERVDHAIEVAWQKQDLTNFAALVKLAAQLRGLDEPEPPAPRERARPVVIYSINPEDVGIPRADRRTLAQFIDNLPELSEKQKNKIRNDAGVNDNYSLFEEIIEDEENQS